MLLYCLMCHHYEKENIKFSIHLSKFFVCLQSSFFQLPASVRLSFAKPFTIYNTISRTVVVDLVVFFFIHTGADSELFLGRVHHSNEGVHYNVNMTY